MYVFQGTKCKTRTERNMMLDALKQRWPMTPERRELLVFKAMQWAMCSDPRTSLKAINTLISIEGQNQRDDHCENQLMRTIAAIEARLRFSERLPSEPTHPLLIEHHEDQGRSSEDLEHARLAVLAAIDAELAEREADGSTAGGDV